MTYLVPFSGHTVCQPEEGTQFISPDVQCCADNAEGRALVINGGKGDASKLDPY